MDKKDFEEKFFKENNFNNEPILVTALENIKNRNFQPYYKRELKGWVVTTFVIAYIAFFKYDSMTDAFKFIVDEFPGSDTDTNASVCGGLFGALYGLEKMKEDEIINKNIIHVNKIIGII